MEKHPLVRTIYLYLFTIIGLVLVVTGTVRFIDLGLKVFIFKQADAEQRLQIQYPCSNSLPISMSKLDPLVNQSSTSTVLTADELATLKSFLDNYAKCQAEAKNINYLTSQRQRDASTSLAMILVGAPLYLFHWRIISRETKKREESSQN
ncbi:MAG: hypothetical protein PHF44_02950 [Candidatus Pacebacteria bacterium]|nr:hypothetical protein [Candidatus Paceibacterota bacterium]